MPLVDANDLFSHARTRTYEVPRLAIRDLDDLQAAFGAAEGARAPVCLVVEEGWRAEYLLPAVVGRAIRSSVPCVAAFAATTEQGAIDAIARGANCVIAERLDIRTISTDCGVPLAGASSLATLGEPLPCAGRADDAASACAPWRPVEHCIAYNFAGSEEDARRMAERGRRELGAIPGVMNIFTGRAVDDSARFRFVWLVRFAHRTVIESYRKHPVHVAFADSAFRPNAKDRRSIDFEAM